MSKTTLMSSSTSTSTSESSIACTAQGIALDYPSQSCYLLICVIPMDMHHLPNPLNFLMAAHPTLNVPLGSRKAVHSHGIPWLFLSLAGCLSWHCFSHSTKE